MEKFTRILNDKALLKDGSKRSPLCFPLAESVPSFIFLVIESFLLLGADGITFWDYSKGGRSLTGVRVDETSLST